MADGSLAPETFSQLMAQLRPSLHRYCARMVGSAFDGEDVVQEALAKAATAFPTSGAIEHPDRWLFRIAHNAALDALRSRKRHAGVRSDEDMGDVADLAAASDVRVAAAASLAVLMRLPVAQRSCVVLVDVLGHALDEVAELLDFTLPATKAALHRGRARLKDLADAPEEIPPRLDPVERDRLRAYADRFNARDFDALRVLLAEDVRLDVKGERLHGRDVRQYFSRYADIFDVRLAPAIIEGQPVALVYRNDALAYFVAFDWRDGNITKILDFRYAGYVLDLVQVHHPLRA